MPNPDVDLVIIQSPVPGGDPAGNDAEVMPFGEEWSKLHAEECGCVLPWQSCDADRWASRKRYGGYIPYDEF